MDSPESIYGSDRIGLVWAYRLAPGQPAVAIDAAGVVAWLESTRSAAESEPDSFLWVHFSLSNAASERWMRMHLDLPDAFYDSLHVASVSTRLEQEGTALIANLHDVRFDASFDSTDIASVSISLEPHLMVSARLQPLRSVDRLRAALKNGQIFASTGALLAQLLRDQAGVLVEILRRSTERVDEIEDKLLARRVAASRRELGSMRRVLVRLQRLLAPEPAALFRLLNRPPAWIGTEELQELRQAAEEFSAAVTDTAALSERIKLLQEEMAALINEQGNNTLFVLTMVTVLALPINLVAGLFGMNVGGVPFSQDRHGFFVVVGLVSLLTCVLAWIGFRRRD